VPSHPANDSELRADEAELAQLRTDPSGTVPPLPALTTAYELPIVQLSWEDFERLCERLARLEGTVRGARRYGRLGQKQHGIDIYGTRTDGRYRVWQCRQYQDIDELNIGKAVEDLLEGRWGEAAANFTFCTALTIADTTLEDEVTHWREYLSAREPPIVFELWDGREISHQLTNHPELVRIFLGPDHERLFFGPSHLHSVGSAPDRHLLGGVASASGPQIRIISLGSSSAAAGLALERLKQESPSDLIGLLALVGEPPQPNRAEHVIRDWPPLLESCHEGALVALALLAENDGDWAAASTAWEGLARRIAGHLRDEAAEYIALAAIAARVGGDRQRYEHLLEDAKRLAPTHPRVVFEQIRDDMTPEERIRILSGLKSDEPFLQALITCHLSGAYLLIPDPAKARRVLDRVASDMRESYAAKAGRLNLTIQEARLALIEQRPVDGTALRETRVGALALRDEMLARRRYEESAGLLMVAADALMLLGDRAAAIGTLAGRKEEEVVSHDGAQILAFAALRIGDPRSAIDIIDTVPLTHSLARLRAAAVMDSGRVAEIPAALATLDEAIAKGGEDATEAALFRLAATLLEGVEVPWSVPAEEILSETRHERVAVIARSFHLVRRHADFAGAYDLLDEHGSAPWALSTRLRLAERQGSYPIMREAARAVLASGPGQDLRTECGRALARSGDFEEAITTLIAVAREATAPDVPRANAYYLLVGIAGRELDDWERAATFHDEWTRSFPSDSRASAFAPMIANRRCKQP